MDRLCISVAAAGRSLGIGRTKIYELINSGKLETVLLGRRRLVRVDSLKALIGAA